MITITYLHNYVSHLVVSLLLLPHFNAEIECVFSQINIVKTKLRNRLSVKTLIPFCTSYWPKVGIEMMLLLHSSG